MSDALPASVQQFIRQHIPSIAQLELLLALSAERGKSWSVDEAAKTLYTAASTTKPLLEALRASGLLALSKEGYTYAPKSADADRAVLELKQLYQTRRVSVINLIYAPPVDQVQRFADAFRIRKPPED